jgi:hypothetical protein
MDLQRRLGRQGRDDARREAPGRDPPPRPGREHRFFVGALDASDLPLVQRLAFRMRGGRSGDHRDWAEIDAWADEIARQLAASRSVR